MGPGMSSVGCAGWEDIVEDGRRCCADWWYLAVGCEGGCCRGGCKLEESGLELAMEG